MKNIRIILVMGFFFILLQMSAQTDTVYIYGPGGPYPAINEVAKIYGQNNNEIIKVTKGPLKKWQEQAKIKADIIYSGAEFMMTNFIHVFNEEIITSSITPLYLRKSGLLVRTGNPKKIKSLNDMAKPGVKILVVHGAGLTGVWEDMAGKSQDIELLKKIRKNIVLFADNSGAAKREWIRNNEIDVWITWNIWQISNPQLADFVPLKKQYTIYRDFGIALTKKGKENKAARELFNYLKSKKLKPIFEKWGWQ